MFLLIYSGGFKCQEKSSNAALDQTLGPIMFWGLGVGYVISGMYLVGTLPARRESRTAIATLFITIMYVTFTFSATLNLFVLYQREVLFHSDRAL